MELSDNEKVAVIEAMKHERARCDAGFVLLSELGVGFHTDTWQKLTNYRNDVASALVKIRKSFKEDL